MATTKYVYIIDLFQISRKLCLGSQFTPFNDQLVVGVSSCEINFESLGGAPASPLVVFRGAHAEVTGLRALLENMPCAWMDVCSQNAIRVSRKNSFYHYNFW